MKRRRVFVCEKCGYTSPKWFGRCPECGEWNTAKEMIVSSRGEVFETSPLLPLSNITSEKDERMKTGFSELDRALNGGIVPGQVILLAGEPGVGKSTLALEIADNFSEYGNVVYLSGEESLTQLKIRSKRTRIKNENKIFVSMENDLTGLFEYIEKIENLALLIVDSLQTIFIPEYDSAPGSVLQIRETTMKLIKFAKSKAIPVLLIGHVTKEGEIAGPKLVEHMVDTVIYFEGEKGTDLRIFRINKNRFGPSGEIVVFEMREDGIFEVTDPVFVEEGELPSGNVLTCILEGTRAFVVQVQALVSKSKMANPRRVGRGIDANRIITVSAVMSKKFKLPLENHDIYMNVVGGIRITDPAADLAIALAMYSSLLDIPLGNLVAIGEIGLDGRVRKVYNIKRRIINLKKYEKVLIPWDEGQFEGVIKVRDLSEALRIVGRE